MNQVESLRREHRQIEQMAAELAAFVAAPTPPEPVAFLHVRRAFARALSLHLKREDWDVYPRLGAHPHRDVRDLASSFCAASATFSTAFAVYGRDWTSHAIAGDWKGFQAATRALLASLDERIAMEENQLYPLLAQGGDEVSPPPRRKLFIVGSENGRPPAGRAMNARDAAERSPRFGG